MNESKPIDVIKPKRPRYDSLGTPESSFKIMLINLARKAGIISKHG